MNIYTLQSEGYRENTYIYVADGDCVIIDPGCSAEKIIERLNAENLAPRGIFVTHGHFDHIEAANELRKKFCVSIYSHELDEPLTSDAVANYSSVLTETPIVVKSDILLKNDETVSICAITFRTIHTPGHTAGSCCFYDETNAVIFTGDTLFFETVGRTDLPTSSGAALARSVEKLFELPDNVAVYPGHGRPTNIGHEKNSNATAREIIREFAQ